MDPRALTVAPALPSTRPSGPALALAGMFLVLILPLFVFDLPPLGDYTNHLARVHIALRADGDPNLTRYYDASLRLVPSLGSDAILLLLAHVVPVEVAGRIFVGLTLAATIGGAALLHRVLYGRLSYWLLTLGLVAYHGALMGGFLSYSLGLALSLFLLAGWIHWRPSPTAWRVAYGILGGALLYLCHVQALGLFGIALAAFEIVRRVETRSGRTDWRGLVRDATVLVLPFVAPAVHFLSLNAGVESDGPRFGEWEWMHRVLGVIFPFASYSLQLDFFAAALVIAFLLILRPVRVAPAVSVALLLMGLVFMAVPEIVFGNAFVARRITPFMALLFIAGSRPRPLPVQPHAAARIRRIAIVMAASVFALRQFLLVQAWHHHDDYAAEVREAVQVIDRGAKVLVTAPARTNLELVQRGAPGWQFALHRSPALVHTPTLALAERSALISVLFSHPAKQFLTVRPEHAPLVYPNGNLPPAVQALDLDRPAPQGVRLRDGHQGYDHVVIVYADRAEPEVRVKLDRLPALWRSERLVILAVDPDI